MSKQTVFADPLAQKTGDDAATPTRVLFVCTGNTCRSPMAAAVLNDRAAPREICTACAEQSAETGRYVAFSAGLYAAQGAPITPHAAEALREAGIVCTPSNDYEAHRAHTVTAEDVANADMVVAITTKHAMELLMRFPDAASKIRTLPMDIADPFGGTLATYRECLMQLRYCLQIAFGEAGGTP